jgi:two-component system chemotaxis sensor kinase CheA
LTARRESTPDHDHLVLSVTDTGVGIPVHAQQYIFDEFRQVDGSTNRQYGGTGLGLAITRNLCRLMDGTIRLTSEISKGSSFIVILPIVELHE